MYAALVAENAETVFALGGKGERSAGVVWGNAHPFVADLRKLAYRFEDFTVHADARGLAGAGRHKRFWLAFWNLCLTKAVQAALGTCFLTRLAIVAIVPDCAFAIGIGSACRRGGRIRIRAAGQKDKDCERKTSGCVHRGLWREKRLYFMGAIGGLPGACPAIEEGLGSRSLTR